RAGPSHLHGVGARAHTGRVSCGARRPGAFAVPLPGSTLAEDCVTAATRTVEHVTCLGCGCACDDITVVVQRGRLTEAQRACALRGAADGRAGRSASCASAPCSWCSGASTRARAIRATARATPSTPWGWRRRAGERAAG